MKLLVFSDLHNDFRTASKLVELSNTVDGLWVPVIFVWLAGGWTKLSSLYRRLPNRRCWFPETVNQKKSYCRPANHGKLPACCTAIGKPSRRLNFSASEAVYPSRLLDRGVMIFPKMRPTVYLIVVLHPFPPYWLYQDGPATLSRNRHSSPPF